MKDIKLAIALGAALAMGTVTTTTTQAMPVAQLGSQTSVLLHQARFVFRGRNYCFYWDGWRGPGWYRCGFERRRGLGWGGPRGWHGWRVGPRPRRRPAAVVRPRPRPPGQGRPSSRPSRPTGGAAGTGRPGGDSNRY